MVTRIGKYEVESEIGDGGFGRVYRAHDPFVDRYVAIKILNAQPDPEMLGQFRAEAKTTGNLRHKNIVTVYDFGEHEGVPFLVMELLEGQNLDVTIRTRKDISLISKLEWLHQAAEGLLFAHQMGVIHRDVKPANIMLLPTGTIKIMDFGIANMVNLSGTRQTGRASITGTPRYMAPEQLTGSPADVQTDIFSFGLVCYECVSGTHPFQSAEESRTFRTALTAPQSLAASCPECPDLLSAAVGRALEFDRNVRYPSLEDMLFDFQPILLEARRDHAEGLMAAVERLEASDEPEHLRGLLRQVLEFDPSHPTARKMLEKLRADERALAVRRGIEERLHQGAARLEAKDYSGAIASFEGALRADSSCEEARTGLEKAKALLENSRCCARLLSNARYEAESGSVPEAFALVEQALAADPANEQALGFRRELRISVAVRDSRELRGRKEFETAEELLSELPDSLRHSAVQNELAAIQRDRELDAQERRRKDFHDRRTLLERERDAGNWIAALKIALDSRELFPERENEISEWILELREGQAASKRAAAIGGAIAEATHRLAEGLFLEAIETTENGLRLYPRERKLLELKEHARALLLESEIAEAVQSVEFAILESRRTGEWQTTLDRVGHACDRHPGMSELEELRGSVIAEAREHETQAEWHGIEASVRGLLPASPAQAVVLLEANATAHGNRPQYESLLQQAKLEMEFQSCVEASLSYIEQRNWRKAGVSLECAAVVHPDRPELDRLASQIVAGQKLERVSHAVAAIRRSSDQRDFAGARQLLDRLAALTGSEEQCAALSEELSLAEAVTQGAPCPKCGAISAFEAKFCDTCGTNLLLAAANRA